MSQAPENTRRVRQADLADLEAVTDVLIAAMQEDRDWWNYRFPYRKEFPEDHRRFMGLLARTWLEPANDDWVVFVAEARADAQGQLDTDLPFKIVSYAAWNMSYVNFRKHGPSYEPQSPKEAMNAAGAANRRDANPAHVKALSECAQACQRRCFAPYTTEHIHLQALGTLSEFQRRGHGSVLVRWGMERAAQDGVVATLMASPMGRNVYPRLGWEELGEFKAQAHDEEEHTFLYPMVYDPRRHAT